MRTLTAIMLCLSILPFFACRKAKPLPQIGEVSRIEVVDNLGESKVLADGTIERAVLKVVTDKEKIQRIVAFVDQHRAGWGVPWQGVPIPNVNLLFYDEKEFKGSFGVGRRSFVTQRYGRFMSKNLTVEERREILMRLGIEEEFLLNPPAFHNVQKEHQ